MSENKTLLGFVGSPNPDGRTNQLVTAALDSAADAGATVEKVQMSEFVVEPCQDCLPWVCMKNLKCSHDDENFAILSEKILNCGGLVFGTPVYWWDTSAMVRYLVLKMFRVFAMSGPLNGLPAFGIAIAGGTGNGLISGLRPVYHFFQMLAMRALDPVPATRFDFDQSLKRSSELGREIAGMVEERNPFTSLEERLLWYDNIPYLGMNRAEERNLLAALTTESVPEARKSEIQGDMSQAGILAASGKSFDAQREVGLVYKSSVKIFEAL